MNRSFCYGLLGMFLLFIGSCADNEADQLLEDTPSIQVVDIQPREVQEFQGNVTLTLSYKDGNGDLGAEDPDEKLLWIKDNRLDQPDYYFVKPLAPIGSNVPIEGTLEVVLNKLFLLGNDSTEQVSFRIKIQDRAGNWSNEVESPTVLVKR